MKLVILAGGLGTRLGEETSLQPKPMVEIGGRPILWHIMKAYAHYGVTDFIVCLGYKGYVIKEYFANYLLHRADVTIDLQSATIDYHRASSEPWKVTLVDTGVATMTGGRLARVRPYLDRGEPFFLTYGDGLTDLRVDDLLAFHRAEGKAATVTAVRPPGRFGSLSLQDALVTDFLEKPEAHDGYVSGGFFVLTDTVFDLLVDDTTIWEHEPLRELARRRDLAAFRHDGFWQCMDTPRDRQHLDDLWQSGRAPWRVWDQATGSV